jgi:hypothetical protein
LNAAFALLLAASARATALPPMEGPWGIELEVASITRVPVLRDVQSTMVAWALAEVTRDGEGYLQTHRVCDVEVTDTSRLSRTIIPRAYVEHMPYRTLRPVSDPAAGRWEVDLGPVPVGYHYERSPGTLPRAVDDPLVYDWDQDGHPGATVQVALARFQPFEVYIAQVSHLYLRGTVRDAERIEGPLEILRQERVTLGASNRLFARPSETTPDPARSRFRMRRLPAGTTCAEVRALLEAP